MARGKLRYANAGHPTPLCVHRALRTAEPLPAGGSKPDPVLGIVDDAPYHSWSYDLSAGDTVLLFPTADSKLKEPMGNITISSDC